MLSFIIDKGGCPIGNGNNPELPSGAELYKRPPNEWDHKQNAVVFWPDPLPTLDSTQTICIPFWVGYCLQ